MKTNIPIYRAKKIDSDEYVEGHYFYENIDVVKHEFKDGYRDAENHYMGFGNGYVELINPSTLAIHFPDMIDSEGTKIFASLSEDGKGGDIIDDLTEKMIVRYDSVYRSIIVSEEMMFYELNFARVKVTGIQE